MKNLLDQQTRLLEYLTDPDRIEAAEFDDGLIGGILSPQEAKMVAGLGLQKRFDKILSVLPKTFEEMGDIPAGTKSAFATASPPESIGAVENAAQFVDFCRREWEAAPPHPPYLPDLANFELTIARVRSMAAPSYEGGAVGAWYRASRAGLVECAYDIRAIYDVGAARTGVVPRPTILMVAYDAARGIRVFEVNESSRSIFNALADGPLTGAELECVAGPIDGGEIQQLRETGVIGHAQ